MSDETPLKGGMYDDGTVVRVGDTVRRPLRASSTAAQALLRHLEHVGFDGAPRFLGVDERGREILDFVPGDVPIPPYPAWALTDPAIAALGRLVRRYHDAVATFDGGSATGWSTEWADPAGGRFVCHNDLFPENVVYRDGLPVALIDFGEASPGRPLWDLAIAAEVWAPLTEPSARSAHLRGADAIARVGLLARGYGLEPGRGRELVDIIDASRQRSQAHIREEIADGNEILAAHWHEHGGDAQAVRDDAWLQRNRAALIAAVG